MSTTVDILKICACLPAVVAVLEFAPPAAAQSTLSAAAPTHVITPGATAVSGFSGAALAGESLSPGVHPINKTVIDIGGASLRIFDLTALGAPPSGQVAIPPLKLELQARDIGQVFALAFDDSAAGAPPNLYAAATSAFGIHIVAGRPDADGKPVRLRAGAPAARFMDGQFGSLSGSGPGTIWKIDGRTGDVSVFGNTAHGGLGNSGPGLGGIATDSKSRSLYVSDLDSGLIHRFALDGNAASNAPFDHGVAGRPARRLSPIADDGRRMDITKPAFKADDPATWGFTQRERRVDGLAVHEGRLYYAVAAGPEIWSVRLNADGSFGTDPRLETEVKSTAGAIVTTILFDTQGRMTLALRGALKSAYDFQKLVEPDAGHVLRYRSRQAGDRSTSSTWRLEQAPYPVGTGANSHEGAGGITLGHGYRPDGVVDLTTCSATLLVTGDTLVAPAPGAAVHGIQLGAIDLASAGAPTSQFAFTDFDGRYDDPDARGRLGDVKMFQRCDGAGARVADAREVPPPVSGASPPARTANPARSPANAAPAGGGASPGGSQSPPGDIGGEGAAGGAPGAANASSQAAACSAPDGAANGTCVPPEGSAATSPPSPGKPNLTLAKAPLGECLKSNIEWRCSFTITITNAGQSAFNGPITLRDGTQFAARLTLGSCGSDRTETAHVCDIPAQTIEPGKSIELMSENFLPFDSVPRDTPAGECVLRNVVDIGSPATENGNQSASAEAKLPPIVNHGAAVPCDPPSLKLAKTAQDCSPAGNNFECRYKLTVTSTGPDPYQDAPIEISEALPAGATVTAHSRGWACSGNGPATQCRTAGSGPNDSGADGRVTLAVGASLDLELFVTVPKSAAGRSGCEVSNSAQIIQGGRDLTGAGEQLRASATAKVNSPECQPPAPVAAPRGADCFRGMVAAAGNRCECPAGTTWNGSTCASTGATRANPVGEPSRGATFINAPATLPRGPDRASSNPAGGPNLIINNPPSGGMNRSINDPQSGGEDRAGTSPVSGGTNRSINDTRSSGTAGGSGKGLGSCPAGTSFVNGACFGATSSSVSGSQGGGTKGAVNDLKGGGTNGSVNELKGAGPRGASGGSIQQRTRSQRAIDTVGNRARVNATNTGVQASGRQIRALGKRPQASTKTTSIQTIGPQLKIRGALGRRPAGFTNTRIRYGGGGSKCPLCGPR